MVEKCSYRPFLLFKGLFLHPWDGEDGFNLFFELIKQSIIGPSWLGCIVRFMLPKEEEVELKFFFFFFFTDKLEFHF